MEAGGKDLFDDSRGGEDPPVLDIQRSARFPFFLLSIPANIRPI
jgi:hypothetical protein